MEEPESTSPLQSYLELLRLPKVFTAVADVAMGFFFVHAAWAFRDDPQQSLLPIGAWTLGLLAAVSAMLYSAGMVLNDVFDVELDRQEQPYRPLPSGRIAVSSARWLGWQLLALGVLLAGSIAVVVGRYGPAQTADSIIYWRPALVAAALAALVVLYNAGLKRTPLGPVAMGGCRMLNVLLGMSLVRQPWRVEHWAVAAGIGVYIAGVTWFARNDARRSDRRQLAAAALVMLAGVGLIAALPRLTDNLETLQAHPPDLWRWYSIVALWAVYILIRCLAAIIQPSPGPVRAVVRRLITALVFLDAAACYAAANPMYALCIAALVVPTTLVARWVDRG